jgi:ABC-type lipoprotein export system ATPase subunit
MTGDSALIRLSGITRTYGQGQAAFQALKGVDMAVDAGEFVAIMGPSGSGKSTVMNILGCLDTPSSGAYLFQDVAVERLTRDQRALLRRHYLGFVFQGFNLLARTTALENVELPLIYRREPAAARRHAMARAALAQVGLQGWEHHTPGELSGGQQQRVAIARAIVTRPPVLLADEPTGNLDTATSREIMDLLAALNRDRGITVLMVTHEPDMAAVRGASSISSMAGWTATNQHRSGRLMLWNTLLLALRAIRRNLMRSFLTTLGIVIGVAAVITMVTLGNGATRSVSDQIASMGSNLLMAMPGQRFGPGSSGAPNFKLADTEVIRSQIPAVDAVAPAINSGVTAVTAQRTGPPW